jgi:hypothetical protein
MDAGRFDAATAYAAVNRIRLDDQQPHVYRTHDGGKTWQEIVRGLPDNAPVNAVREDSERPGLLFAGTERAVFVSFNDGEDWQSLRLNMPATSIRDLVVHDDDVVVGTHGRSFWVLDDITPLRQIDAKVASAEMHLFKPQVAYRVRNNLNHDTPLPPDEPAGQNPPDGAVIDYYLKAAASGPVTLEILDAKGQPVRRFSSEDKPEAVSEKDLDIPTYWIRPPRLLSAAAGAHRFVWDLHYPPPEGGRRSYPMTAIYRDTPSAPLGPWVLPGRYVVRLTAVGKTVEQPLTVKMDPRVKAPAEVLARQHELSMQCYGDVRQARETLARLRKLRSQIEERKAKAWPGELADALAALDRKAAALEGTERRRGEKPAAGPRQPTLAGLAGESQRLQDVLQGADAEPTTQAATACADAHKSLRDLLGRWDELSGQDVKSLNERLRRGDLPPLDP